MPATFTKLDHLLKQAQAQIDAESKQGFVDAQNVAMGADPAAMGGQPMDPAMAGGAPPQDPAATGQAMPTDPAAAPAMDPAAVGLPPPDPAAAAGAMTPAAPKMKIDINAEVLILKRMVAKLIDDVTKLALHFQVPGFTPMSAQEMTALPEELSSMRQQEPGGGGAGGGAAGGEQQSAIPAVEPMQAAVPKQSQYVPPNFARQQSQAEAMLMLMEFSQN